jgi:hypothetical protein
MSMAEPRTKSRATPDHTPKDSALNGLRLDSRCPGGQGCPLADSPVPQAESHWC